MLKHLHIKHFTIVTEQEIEFSAGLTVLTGETGAGKSILIDALGVVLGERAEVGLIKQGSERCEVTASFALEAIPAAQQWLLTQDLDEDAQCLLRRVISRDGRSRSTINGRPCTLQQVRELAVHLVHVHAQNQHTWLLKTDYQRQLLDEFAGHHALCAKVEELYKNWRKLQQEYNTCLQTAQDRNAQQELLNFQLQEFAQLDLKPGELAALAEEQACLAHAEQWLASCQQALTQLVDSEQYAVVHNLYAASQLLKNAATHHTNLAVAAELLQQAIIQVQEAVSEVRRAEDALEPDPARLSVVDQRLAVILDVARKHKVTPEQLLEKHANLAAQLQQLTTVDEHLAELAQQITELAATYKTYAQQLTASRQQAAAKLSAAVTQHMQMLGMGNGEFQAQVMTLELENVHPHGNENISFQVSTNAGQPLQALAKVVSGGELSRIALAIQVITAQLVATPTLIFDEVDVGIGGSTAEVVGQQLKQLGKNAQVLCVTHLPQVAAQGDQHLHVSKQQQAKTVETQIRALSAAEKIDEIARMLGGVTITHKTLAHAKEMLGLVD